MLVRTIKTNFLIQAINLATSVLAARILGATGRGELALVLLYPQLVAAFWLLGIDRAVSVLGGRGHIDKPVRLISLVSAAISIPAVMMAYWLVQNRISDPLLQRLAEAYILYVPALYFFSLSVAYFNGVGNFDRFNLLRSSYYILYVGLISGLLLTSIPNLAAFVFANLFAVYGVFLLSTISLTKSKYKTVSINPATHPRLVSLMVRTAAAFMIPAGLAVLSSMLYQLILVNISPAKSLGIFVVYFGYSRLLSLVANAFNVRMFHMSIIGHDKDLAFRFRTSLLISIGCGFVLFALSPYAISIVYGEDFGREVLVAQMLLISALFFFSAEMLSEYFRGREENRIDAVGQGVYLGLVGSLGILLVPNHDITGMAIAVIVGDAGRFCFLAIVVRHMTSLKIRDLVIVRWSDVKHVISRIWQLIVAR